MPLIIEGEIWKTKDGNKRFLILAEYFADKNDDLVFCFDTHKCTPILLEKDYLLSTMEYDTSIAPSLMDDFVRRLKKLNKNK